MGRKKILIVGGGTAGWITATVLHKKYDVHLVESKDIPTIGVGESTTEVVMDALREAGVDLDDFMSYCNATPKYGVKFVGWSERDYFHPFGENFLEQQYEPEECEQFLTKCYKAGRDITALSPYTAMAEKGLRPDFDSGQEFFNDVALHWQANTVPQYLKNFLKDKITHTYDTVENVNRSWIGITGVKCKDNYYIADYYVDCTGGARLLSKKLGVQWNSWKHETLLDSVITYSCKPNPKIYYTTSTAWDNGWEWSIPLQDKMQHGYVYSSKYCTKEQAIKEAKRRRGDIEVLNTVHFHSGVLEKVAYKNLISIGLSAHFIEPLEATNIEFAVISAKEFDKAIDNNQSFVNLNTRLMKMIDEIKKFIIFHYYLPNKSGQFWKDVRGEFSEEDIVDRKQIYPWHIFNWYSVAQGINFDKEQYDVDVEVDYLTSQFQSERKVSEIERVESCAGNLPSSAQGL